MEELSVNNKKVDFIRILQNPSKNTVENCKNVLKELDVDCFNESQWIKFENKFSVENFSGLEGAVLEQIILILSVFNTQGGVASEYMHKINLIPRSEMLRIYYKYIPLRQLSYITNTFYFVSTWLYENDYISELELNRALCYSVDGEMQSSVLGGVNRIIIQEEIKKYVKESWSQLI